MTQTETLTLPHIIASDHRVRRFGYAVVLIMFGFFGGWSVLAPIGSAALAPGVVTVQTYRKTVQHLEGGIVKELLARDGDHVETGQPLIILDDTQLRAEYDIVLGQLLGAQATEARLLAERDQLDSINFDLMTEIDSRRALEAQEGETQVFTSRRRSHQGEREVLQQRVGQLKQQIKGLNDLVQTKQKLAQSYRSEVKELRDLLKDGYIDKQRLLEQERRLDTSVAEAAEHKSEVIRIQLQIIETELQIVQLDKQFNTEVVGKLAEVQAHAFDLEQRLLALQERINRIVIRAPDSGMVIGMKVHTVGGVISSGTPLLDIVPSASDLVIEAEVSPMDIDRVEIGKLADIRFSAFNSATTPVIQGVVAQISGDRLINEQTGMPYYLSRVQLTEEGLKALGHRQLVPGMPAEVLINTGERTLFQYLMQPVDNAFARSLIED
ncbi:HlyD family type I secretion periplasmic adaptor subunit [Paenalcaligenes hominis]|uniref:HlyD family type I secretion periplasmic adaptor subunit n=1 Tax=Paenalcaligenes hominis TaxID=643674 RepID=UPI003524B9E1